MSIRFDEQARTFTLTTRNTTYQMQIGPMEHLLHLYYGRRTAGDRLDYQYRPMDSGFSPNIYEVRRERSYSMDLLPQEYSSANTGDFRVSALEAVTEDGVYGTDLKYVSHSVNPGKYAVEGMPSAYAREGEAETLTIVLADGMMGVRVELLYAVYEERDVITRAVRLTNAGTKWIKLEQIGRAHV